MLRRGADDVWLPRLIRKTPVIDKRRKQMNAARDLNLALPEYLGVLLPIGSRVLAVQQAATDVRPADDIAQAELRADVACAWLLHEIERVMLIDAASVNYICSPWSAA